MAEVKIEFWKDKVKSHEENTSLFQEEFPSFDQVQNANSQSAVLEAPVTFEENVENETREASSPLNPHTRSQQSEVPDSQG